ncbi:MAG: hypothetical protein LZ162_03645 [Thaumarchaeota archaeon]|jgi:predicted GH43/DUF377 family glycosyl hydrolase|nr:hypothetical protein [Candidatus Terraquivivens yellowstonensis]
MIVERVKIMERYGHNPVLSPTRERAWEAYAVFNPSVIKRGKTYYMLYRAISSSDLLRKQGSSFSSIGIAKSKDGVNFSDRRRFIFPEEDWERFGCEDPRVTYIDGKYYIFYTAISTMPPRAEGIRVGVAVSRDLRTIEGKYLVTPFNAKAMALFPERIGGKLTAVLTVNTDQPPAYIGIAQLGDDPAFWYSEMEDWYKNLKEHVLTPDPRRSSLDHIEVGAPPIKLKNGWLLIYSYIQNYFLQDVESRVFGVEALLLDLKDPRKVLAKTDYPFMVAEEFYEWYGHVPRVVFPTSALLEDGKLKIYYGAADTTCCLATVKVREIMDVMKAKAMPAFTRYPQNPIIKPNPAHDWESLATFNPAAIELEGKIYILYRALSADKTSTIGLAVTKDGFNIVERLDKPVYVPREHYEMKLTPGHSGCEDPRIVRVGDRLYMFYTAYDNVNPPRVALTSIKVDDFLAYNWDWEKPRIISPPGIDDKNACIIPERINDKYIFIHRTGGINIVYDYINSLDSIDPSKLLSFKLIRPRIGMWDGKKVGLATPPIKTEHGWLLFYHGVSADNVYRVGAALLDAKNPENVIARTTGYLLEPLTSYEKEGYVRNVVFPCGAVVRGDTIHIYYGAADTYVCTATASLKHILTQLIAK